MPDPDAAGPRPRSLDLAVRLMYGGAVLALLGALLAVVGRDRLRADVAETLAGEPGVTPAVIDTAFGAGLAAAVGFGLLSAGLWVLMAVLNGRGVRWARVVGTVLGAGTVLAYATSLGRARPLAAAVALELAIAVVAGVVVWLLWRPASSRYYATATAVRGRGGG